MAESMVTAQWVRENGGRRTSLHEPFNLAGNRSEEVQYFTMKSQLDAHAADGSITA